MTGADFLKPDYDQRIPRSFHASVQPVTAKHTVGNRRDLKKVGVKISADDFGAGYSSLAYLKRLPIDTLKTDRAFVSDLEQPEDAAIVSTVIAMSRSLGMDVVAGGSSARDSSSFSARKAMSAPGGIVSTRRFRATLSARSS